MAEYQYLDEIHLEILRVAQENPNISFNHLPGKTELLCQAAANDVVNHAFYLANFGYVDFRDGVYIEVLPKGKEAYDFRVRRKAEDSIIPASTAATNNQYSLWRTASSMFKKALKPIGQILLALIIAYLIFRLGWN